ncbi:MAG: response regulator, partial [Microcoleus sp. SM1_3_4]|nr:response regulator [Microcoleus sp. SM1_3_4]
RAIALVPEFTASTNFSGLRVLVVDGDWDSLEFVRVVLEGCGAEVETADSEREALEAIQRRAPDVLAIDLRMQPADGCCFLQQIRAIAGSEIPAVALTANTRVEERVRALREGFQLHLPKPIDPAELTAVVASLAARHQ